MITKEGDEYILKHNGCNCSLESERFNADGKLIAFSDRNGNLISLTYNGDRLAAVENAGGRKVEFTSNDDGQITKAVLPEGVTLKYEYADPTNPDEPSCGGPVLPGGGGSNNGKVTVCHKPQGTSHYNHLGKCSQGSSQARGHHGTMSTGLRNFMDADGIRS